MINIKLKILLNLVLFILVLPLTLTVYANEDQVPYSVKAILPENQINDDVSYFDIGMDTEEELTLEVIIQNYSAEEITININNNTATTNSNGLITYDGVDAEPHSSMKYPFNELSALSSDEVKIPAESGKSVTLNVKAPEESFDGIILGGIQFTLEPEKAEQDEGVTVQNRFSYVIGVQIQENENNNEVEPELILEDVNPGIINHRTGLQTEFANTTPVIINDVVFEGEVYKENSEEPLFKRKVEDFSIAPNSKFNFPVMYDNKELETGTYVFKGTATNENNSWKFDQEFEVTEDKADEANDEAVGIEDEEDSNFLMYLVVGLAILVVVLVGIVIALLIKRKK